MTADERKLLALGSIALEYPSEDFFAAIPCLKEEWQDNARIMAFLVKLEKMGLQAAREHYVSVFDLAPGSSLHLSWHRYGNDRGQGRALAALNGLYRSAGFEPLPGAMPDYLPRMLEFVSVCDDWATETILDGFGAEIAGIEKNLHGQDSPWHDLLKGVLEPLRKYWGAFFKARKGPDPTARPMRSDRPEAI